MYSTARVVSSSHAGTAPRADDEPRPADEDDDEEDLETPQPSTRTVQEGFVNDLNWDEDDEPMASTYRPVQHPMYTSSSENHHDVQAQVAAAGGATTRRSSHRARVRVDERSPLLARDSVPEAEAAPEPTGPLPQSPNSISVSAKSAAAVTGQSTFSQTVSPFMALPLWGRADVRWLSFSIAPRCCLGSACFRNLSRSRMRDGSSVRYLSCCMASSRATRTSCHGSSPARL